MYIIDTRTATATVTVNVNATATAAQHSVTSVHGQTVACYLATCLLSVYALMNSSRVSTPSEFWSIAVQNVLRSRSSGDMLCCVTFTSLPVAQPSRSLSLSLSLSFRLSIPYAVCKHSRKLIRNSRVHQICTIQCQSADFHSEETLVVGFGLHVFRLALRRLLSSDTVQVKTRAD